MKFDEIYAMVGHVPFTAKDHGKYLYDLILEQQMTDVLELGIAHGTATCYIAAALQELGRGCVTAVDLIDVNFAPTAEDQLKKTGLDGYAKVVRMKSGYTWFLHDEIAKNTKHDKCAEVYDLCIIDGPKNWTIDGAAFFFADKLLRKDGWMIFDDYEWTYASVDRESDATDGISHHSLSEDEMKTPQISEVFRLLVKQHPHYGTLKVLNESWGLAQKTMSSDKNYTIAFERTTRDLLAKVMTGVYRKLRS
ncbi:class I SAM-dependent methyltransferase [Planctomycetaceae bacterium SH139]